MVYGGIDRNNMQGHTHLVNVKGHVILTSNCLALIRIQVVEYYNAQSDFNILKRKQN